MTIEAPPHPNPYAPSQHQLVLEIYVSNLSRSILFYTSLGFSLDWQVLGTFAQVSWEQSILFLKVKNNSPAATPAEPGSGNIRIMVRDVDAKYDEAKRLGCKIQQEVGDRLFVLRDFELIDPDGFGVRFGSFLKERGRAEQERGPEHESVVRG